MNLLSVLNNCQNHFGTLPKDMILKIFSPREIACVLPYVNKLFNTLANDNDLWNSIAIEHKNINLKLDFPYDYSKAKYSYIIRNIEVSNLFMGRFPSINNQEEESKISIYGDNYYNFYQVNISLKRNEDPFKNYWSKYNIKILQFMLDYCQNPSINGFLSPFIKNENIIVMIMKDYQTILEKEYQMNKSLIDRIDLSRIKNNKPVPQKLNNAESMARLLVNSYESALQIYNNSLSRSSLEKN